MNQRVPWQPLLSSVSPCRTRNSLLGIQLLIKVFPAIEQKEKDKVYSYVLRNIVEPGIVQARKRKRESEREIKE